MIQTPDGHAHRRVLGAHCGSQLTHGQPAVTPSRPKEEIAALVAPAFREAIPRFSLHLLYRCPHRLPCDPAAQRRLAGDAPQTLAGGHVAQPPRKLGTADRHRYP
jgi:hypothetical protein